jgi:hypothetical protein
MATDTALQIFSAPEIAVFRLILAITPGCRRHFQPLSPDAATTLKNIEAGAELPDYASWLI